MSATGYHELKKDYLALVITVADIVDGAAYLFDKELSAGQRKRKAERELEQFKIVLEMDQKK